MKHCLCNRVFAAAASMLLSLIGLASSSAQKITHIAPAPAAQHPFSELTSASADPADSVCARYAAGSTVADPLSLSSSNGQLEVSFHYQSAVDAQGLTRYCYVYTDASGNTHEAPALHVNPGDQLIIHFYNDLSASAASDPAEHTMTMNMQPAAASSTTNPDCSATSVTSSSSNMHFHGTTVAPVCGQDEVIHTLVPAQAEFDYNVQIPANEPPGLYWYHPHPHGYSDPQTIGGASGPLIVDGVQNVNSAVAGLPERVFVLRDQDLPSSDTGSTPGTDLSINYVPITYPSYIPAVIQTAPSQKQFWRVLNAAADTIFDLQVQFGGVAQPLQIVSIDGFPLTDSSGNGITTTVTDYLLAPATRVEFIVPTPAVGATAQLMTLAHNNGPEGDADPKRPIANIKAVAGTTAPQLPAQTAPEQLTRAAAPAPANKRTLYFSVSSGFTQFYITVNGQTPTAFNMDNPPNLTVQGGTVEQWTIENHSLMDHNFHIHQLHFQTLAINGVAVNDTTLRDTVDIPYWSGSGPYPSVTLLMDFRDPNIVGTFVYHCHVLSHEDRGMMGSIQVLPGATTTTLTGAPLTSSYGSPIALTATVAAASGVGMPTGTVSFVRGATPLGTGTLNSSGVASISTTAFPVGNHGANAIYGGSTSFAGSSSANLPLTINPASTTTTLTSAPNPSLYGQAVTLTAQVTPASGPAPTGTVNFVRGATALGTGTLNSSGTASVSTATLPLGAHTLTAIYGGSTNDSGSSGNHVQTILAATTSKATATPNPSSYGQAVVLTATVTATTGPVPTGTVNFVRGATPLGTATLNGSGVATITTTEFPVGNHGFTAIYSGSANDAASSVTVPVTINPSTTTTTLTVTPNPSTYGQTVTLTAKVTASYGPAPAGTVSFVRGATALGSATLNSSGIATVTTNTLPTGVHTLTAIYGGSANDSGSSGNYSQTIQ